MQQQCHRLRLFVKLNAGIAAYILIFWEQSRFVAAFLFGENNDGKPQK
nr:MAG TPA: hypothetical protein [Caudoviricetes sp.]